ncbi:MAG: thiamine-phosphate pyrophosphorylase [Candidatus Omnitrophica bacterium]|nr:thiamine-phosphate pyrophosphorylase [Candidatus Omnitrophota bacterium]
MKKLLKKTYFNKKICRVIDANLNRLKEGLRVIEDILRFIMDDRKLTAQTRKIRHAITEYIKEGGFLQSVIILKERQIIKDVGKKSVNTELKRKNIADIFLANAQRVKESVRVLEEFFKLFDKKASMRFKKLRYRIYHIEKEAIEKITKLCNNNT